MYNMGQEKFANCLCVGSKIGATRESDSQSNWFFDYWSGF